MIAKFLDMVEAAFGVLAYIGGKVSASVFTALVCIGGFVLQTTRLGLWPSGSVGKVLWLALLWFLVWLLTTVLFFHPDIKIASTLLLVVGALIVFQTIGHLAPGTVKGAQLIAEYKDQRVLKSAEAATTTVIKPFACDKTNAANISYFGKNSSGETVALIRYARERTTRHILCFWEDGVYDKTGEEVQLVASDAIINEIAGQEPLQQTVPPPATHVVPAPQLVASNPAPQPVLAATPEPPQPSPVTVPEEPTAATVDTAPINANPPATVQIITIAPERRDTVRSPSWAYSTPRPAPFLSARPHPQHNALKNAFGRLLADRIANSKRNDKTDK